MKIEKAIQQQHFEDEYQKVAINLSYTNFWFKGIYTDFIKPFGITIQQYNVLRILKGQYPNGITTSDIKSRMLDKNSDASRLSERLEKSKLVHKCVNQVDKRLVKVTITELGLDLLEKIRKEESKIKDVTKTLSVKEAETLNFLLDKLRG